ncbi:MAG: hypothetical protein MEP57_07970 [Microvirga sp.]|nr:hypothetical protein [Microvirga sp.]
MSDTNADRRDGETKTLTRRAMFLKLGLAAGAVYLAPVALSVSEARASGYSRASFSRASFSRPSRSDGRRRSGRRG